MKIALFAYYFSESTITLCKYLAEKGNSVEYYLITSKETEELAGFSFKTIPKTVGLHHVKYEHAKATFEFMGNNNVNIYLVRLFNHSIKLRSRYLNFIISLSILLKLRTKYFDVAHFVGQHQLLILFHKLIKAKKKIHTLHEIDDHLTKKQIHKRIIDFLKKHNKQLIVHSDTVMNRLVNEQKFSAQKISSVPFGLFECYSCFEEKSTNYIEKEDFLLYYGLIRPYKGLDILYEAIKILRERNVNVKVLVAGAGYLPIIEEIKKDPNFVLINRFITNEEIVFLNRRAKVIVCPYKSASQSGIIMTSLLFNKPVIASDVGAFSEVIIDGTNSLLVKPEEPEELANKIQIIFKDDDIYRKLVDGIKVFKNSDKFSWENIARRTIELYSSE